MKEMKRIKEGQLFLVSECDCGERGILVIDSEGGGLCHEGGENT